MIELKDDEVVCYKCNGSGRDLSNTPIQYHKKSGLPFYESHVCNICEGTGKLDWIENIFGKKVEDYSEWTSMAINSDTIYVSTENGSVWKQEL